jgi:hypothetical protein
MRLCNNKEASTAFKFDSFDHGSHCICLQHPYSSFVDPHHKHICTLDLNVILNDSLRDLMRKGSKFRLGPAESTLSGMECKESEAFHLPTDVFGAWKDAVITALTPHFVAVAPVAPLPDAFDSPAVQSYLKFLKKHFVITTIDKSTNNFTIVCKHFYRRSLGKETLANGTYSVSPVQSVETVTRTHSLFLRDTLKLEPGGSRLPFLYILPKMHKQPSALRFIAASSVGTSIRPVSLWLSLALKEIMHSCDTLWSTTLKQAGVPCSRSWMIKDSTSFIDLVRGVRLQMAAPRPPAFFQTLILRLCIRRFPWLI